MSEKIDVRIVKSKRNIKNAFLEILEEKNLSEITVKEICEKAMCSRNTFYCHYQYKDDLYDEFLDDCIRSIEKATAKVTDYIDHIDERIIYNYIENIVHELGKSNRILRILIKSDQSNGFRIKLEDSIYDNFIEGGKLLSFIDTDFQYMLYCRYLASGIVGFLMQWIFYTNITEEEAKDILYSIHSAPIKVSVDYLRNRVGREIK